MSSKKKIILLGIIFVLLLVLSGLYLTLPKIVIELNGSKSLNLKYGEKYEENGAKAYLKNLLGTKNIKVEITSFVDESKLGNYKVVYSATYKNKTINAVRKVNIIDKEKPELTINSKIKACKKNNLIEIDAKAIDNYDGDISHKIKYKVNNDKVEITVTDSSNNEAKIEEEIEYIDAEAPILKLKGKAEINLYLNSEYIEEGAEAYDSCDGDLTKNIFMSGKVNTNVLGEQEITYQVQDSSNNLTIVKRKIKVIDKNDDQIPQYIVKNGATIYLTFDDGPGQYTEQILNILNNYNIKATFFVTNQFPKYQYVIKKEYDNGHTIGVHTYSHKWTIYKSVDAYLEDFNKIHQIIFDQTGLDTKLFRFPGGSSNTVSRKYCKGIMTKLAKLMTENGYIYYDWTFDSGDTSKTNNSVEDIIKNVKKNLKGDGTYIVLMHDIKKNTLEALPQVIEYAKQNGYSFAALDESVPPHHFKIAN